MGRFRKWWNGFSDQANSTGGALTLATGIGTAGASAIGAPLVVTAVPIVLIGVAVSYCAIKAWPAKSLTLEETVGTVIRDLNTLKRIEPPLKRVGIVGLSQVGKSTTISNLNAHHHTPNVRTDSPYATVTLISGQPPKYFALIDAAGQQYAQQFKVAEESDVLLVFLDHAAGDTLVELNATRLNAHEEFLAQLTGYLKHSGRIVKDIHFVLNKRDRWENSADADKLRTWFASQISPWHQVPGAVITSNIHSNFITTDNTNLLTILRDRI